MTYFVYIFYSEEQDIYYIGSSENPEKRLKKHLSNHIGFTSKCNDWKVYHKEVFQEKSEALKREKQLKAWKSKVRIQQLIEKTKMVRASRP